MRIFCRYFVGLVHPRGPNSWSWNQLAKTVLWKISLVPLFLAIATICWQPAKPLIAWLGNWGVALLLCCLLLAIAGAIVQIRQPTRPTQPILTQLGELRLGQLVRLTTHVLFLSGVVMATFGAIYPDVKSAVGFPPRFLVVCGFGLSIFAIELWRLANAYIATVRKRRK